MKEPGLRPRAIYLGAGRPCYGGVLEGLLQADGGAPRRSLTEAFAPLNPRLCKGQGLICLVTTSAQHSPRRNTTPIC